MELINILTASDEFQLTKLVSHIQTYLLQNQSIILQHDPIEILEIIYNHETCSSLSDKCLQLICKDPNLLFNSKRHLNIDKDLMLLILRRDDFILDDELKIWEYL